MQDQISAQDDPARSATGRDLHLAAFWGVTILCALAYWVNARVSIDDAFVYLRAAETFTRTGVFAFNAGDTFSITTSPAWTVITGALALVSPSGALPTLCKLVFVGCLAAGAHQLYGLFRPQAPWLAVVVAPPLFFSANMLTFAGMETALALFMAAGLVRSFVQRDAWTPLWAALFYLARPEGAVLGTLLGLYLMVEAVSGGRLIATFRRYGRALGLALALVTAWHLWFYLAFHALTPETGNAKILQAASGGWPTFSQSIGEHFRAIYDPVDPMIFNLLRAPVALIGAWVLARLAWPLLIWPVVHYWLYSAIGVAYYHWYAYPIDFVLALSLTAGVATLARGAAIQLERRQIAVPMALAVGGVLAAVLFVLPAGRNSVAHLTGFRAEPSVADSRYDAYVALAKGMNADAAGRPVTLLTHEIGILGFLMPTASVRDVTGLATPITDPADLWNWRKQVDAYRPDYLLHPFGNPPGGMIYTLSDGGALRYTPLETVGPYTVFRRLEPDSEAGQAFARDWDAIRTLMLGVTAQSAALEPIDVSGQTMLFTHAPARFTLTAPAGAAALEMRFGYRPDAYAGGNAPDGARLLVSDAATGKVLLDRRIDPRGVMAHRGVQVAVVDLKSDTINIAYETLETSAWDWTYLGPPRWLSAAEAREARATRVTPSTDVCPAFAVVQSAMQEGEGGFIDLISPTGARGATIQGWAADLINKTPAKRIVVLKDGEVLGCSSVGLARPDVAEALGAPGLAGSGFSVDIGSPASPDGEWIVAAELVDGSYRRLKRPGAP